MKELIGHKTKWKIEKFADVWASKPYEVSEFFGNELLTEGITGVWNLMVGNSYKDFSSAHIGVGTSDTAVDSSHTGLQGTKFYSPQMSGWPIITGNEVSFKSQVGSGDGNFAWQEFTVANAGSDGSENLNRKVSDQGTKAVNQVWTITLDITLI